MGAQHDLEGAGALARACHGLQYDGDSGLRNPFLGQPRGIVGGTMTVNGKPLQVLDPDVASHTFTIPDLGVSVPLKGVADDAKNQCAVDAVHAGAGAQHDHVRRSAPASRACIAGSASCRARPAGCTGFGGPMQTVGWMDGFLKVV